MMKMEQLYLSFTGIRAYIPSIYAWDISPRSLLMRHFYLIFTQNCGIIMISRGSHTQRNRKVT